jgi:KaiC/GvpD/RAD55 family RecA-like ATPase
MRVAISGQLDGGQVARVSTGVKSLDAALSGGYPAGSLILVSGNPGTGKTILTSNFLYEGARKNENGIYVSFSEGKKNFYDNMKTVGLDFEPLEKMGKFHFMEMLTFTKQGMAKSIWDMLDQVRKFEARRLVIDSYSVMAQALDDQYEARQILHTTLSKVVRQMNCTSIIIGEQPSGETKLGDGEAEFVSDGVMNLKLTTPRELEIRKMRGTNLVSRNLFFTIDAGFDVMTTQTKVPPRPKRWQPIPDKGHLLSTGSPDLDTILGGGFPRGAYVLFETSTEVEVNDIRLISRSMALNFIAQHRGALIIPRAGLEAKDVHSSIGPYVDPATYNKYIKVTEEDTIREFRRVKAPLRPYIVPIRSSATSDSIQKTVFEAAEALKKSTGGKPIFRSIAYDRVEGYYRADPEGMIAAVALSQMRTKGGGDLTYAIARPSLQILNKVRDLVEWHFVMTRKNGLVMLQGRKPATSLYAVDSDNSRGYPVMTLRILT